MKGRSKRATGGTNDAAEDLKTKNQRYTYESKVNNEAEERKRGGRTERKDGGRMHGEHCHCEKCERRHARKEGGKVHGENAMHHAGRKPRKSGGRTGSDSSPFTSARHGTPPPGRKLDMEME